jgi:gliding motility-associated-like protein
MPVSTFTSSAASVCVNQNVTFTNSSTFDSRATVINVWDFGDGTNSTLPSPSKSYTAAATRNVQLTISYTGVTGCSNSSSQSIVVAAPQTPAITATLNPICTDESSVLSVTGTYTSYAWTGPATGSSPTLDITQPGTYIVNTVEANGCAGTSQIIIGEKPSVVLTVTADGEAVADGGEVLVVAGIPVQLLASGADSYSWSPAEGLDNASIANPKAAPLTETVYIVTGAKTGQCENDYTIQLKFDPSGNSFLPPNAFSPNGDGSNDVWVIDGVQNYVECTLSIFNKQGSKVFEQKGYTNTWDGTFEGKDLPQGTYYYVLNCPDKEPVTGNVLIAR